MLLCVMLAALSELLLITPLRAHGGSNIVALELAPSAAAFAEGVRRDWTQDASATAPGAEPLCGLGLPHTTAATPRPSLGKLRCNLWLDSLGLVPGYVGLLLVFTLAFVAPGTGPLRKLAWCVPALAAGLADLLENGLTLRALGLLGTPAWTDATMAAIRQASGSKWLMLAVALAVLAHVAWHSGRAAGRGLSQVAAVVCVIGSVALPVGVWLWRPGIALGMAMMVLAFALLAWRQWRQWRLAPA